MKVAIVYDRVNKRGGAERVLLVLHELFPRASIYTSVYHPKKAKWAQVFPEIKTSFLQKVPFIRDRHEILGLLMPIAFETINLSEYDLVISVTSEAAKGIVTRPPTKHICYMLTPTRYLWSHYNQYFKGAFFRSVAKPAVDYLRYWDKIAAQRPDALIAISKEVSKRIKKHYGRDSIVIYPPCDTKKITKHASSLRSSMVRGKEDYYLIVSRLVPYKKIDIAIDAFNILGDKLIIVGTGSEERKLRRKAGKNITFTGFITDDKLLSYYHQAKALIHVQNEDFGLAAVEAQAAGTPVIAYNQGGAQESVVDGVTGVFFERQTEEALVDAVKRFDRMEFDTKKTINNAKRFSKARFKKEFLSLLRKNNII